jgi:hypothetical protein
MERNKKEYIILSILMIKLKMKELFSTLKIKKYFKSNRIKKTNNNQN